MENKGKKPLQISKLSPLPKSKKGKQDAFGGPVFVLAGEHSGDLLGGDLLRELHRISPDTHFYGIGGEEMIAQGLKTLEDLENLSVVGIGEVIKKYSFLKELMEKVVQEILDRNTKCVILIDYPGFNLRLAERLKPHGIRVIFYVSPQIWAWKFNRIYHIRDNVDLMLTLFQFEEDLYRKYGVNAYFVGHPLPKRIQEALKKEHPLPPVSKENPPQWVVGLLPGSRTQEIQKLTRILLQSAVSIQNHFEKQDVRIRFLLPNINPKAESFLLEEIEKIHSKHPNTKIEYAFQASSRVMEACDLLLLASGTATLEGVYWEKPMVVLYKVNFLTYFLGSFLVRTAHIGLVNVLAGKEICRELIQTECTAGQVSREAIAILEDPSYRSRIRKEILLVKSRELSETDGARRAARTISDFLRPF